MRKTKKVCAVLVFVAVAFTILVGCVELSKASRSITYYENDSRTTNIDIEISDSNVTLYNQSSDEIATDTEISADEECIISESADITVSDETFSVPETIYTSKTTFDSETADIIDLDTDEQTNSETVWIPIYGGTKFHRTVECSNMKDPKSVTRDTAIENGYTPCKRCYK